MDGIKFLYKHPNGSLLEITPAIPQYLYLEPSEAVVVRLFFNKNGIDVEQTKMLRQLVNPGLLDVFVRNTDSPYLSRILDFKDLVDGDKPELNFSIDFEERPQTFVDVLFKSTTKDRLRVKISTISEGIESFENENTVTDGPDEFVRLVNVVIRPEDVSYTLIYRRSGKLVQYSTSKTYKELSEILRSRLLQEDNPDRALESTQITRGLSVQGWKIDRMDDTIYKTDGIREILITSDELGSAIRVSGSVLEVLMLLKTNDYSKHPFYIEAEKQLRPGGKEASLPIADIKNTIDLRS